MATMKSTVMTTVKSTMTAEMAEMIDRPNAQPAAIVPVWIVSIGIIPVWIVTMVIVPIGIVLVDMRRFGSGRIVRVLRTANRCAGREADHREHRRAECKPAHVLDMVGVGKSSKTDESITSKRD